MFAQTFYHEHLRKFVVLFGTLFNELFINRVDSSNNEIYTIKVPISYSPKDKLIYRVENDPNLTKQVSMVTPRMGFELTSLNYDPTRKLNTIGRSFVKQNSDSENKLNYLYNPVPYDLYFSLYIAVKNAEDGTRILEQILPYFTPDFTVTVNLIPDMDVKLDIPTTLMSVTSADNYDSDFKERRSLIWTLDFVMKGYIFGPIKKSGVITLANTTFYDNSIETNPDASVSVKVTPGQLANGSPTTDSSATISRDQISANSNWDYIVVKENI